MKEVAISEFKVKCLTLLEQVQKTKKPIRITRFAKPVAEVVPPPRPRLTPPTGLVHEGLDENRGRYRFSSQRPE